MSEWDFISQDIFVSIRKFATIKQSCGLVVEERLTHFKSSLIKAKPLDFHPNLQMIW